MGGVFQLIVTVGTEKRAEYSTVAVVDFMSLKFTLDFIPVSQRITSIPRSFTSSTIAKASKPPERPTICVKNSSVLCSCTSFALFFFILQLFAILLERLRLKLTKFCTIFLSYVILYHQHTWNTNWLSILSAKVYSRLLHRVDDELCNQNTFE